MRKALVVAALMILGFAPSAKAVPVEVLYSVVSVATIPGLGNVHLSTMSGTATVRYQNATALGSNIQNGQARFQSFVASGTVSLIVGGPATLSLHDVGGFAVSLGPIAGNALNGATNQNLNVSSHVGVHFEGTAAGFVHCLGALCTGALGVPASVTVPIPLPFNTNAINVNTGLIGNYMGNADIDPLGNVYPAGTPQLTHQGGFGTAGGFTIRVQNTLTEVSRTVVPEPGTASLVWLGLVGIAGARWHRRTRRG